MSLTTAIVHIDVEADQIPEAAEAIVNIDGVIRTETQLAFRAYSRHDLEAAFSLGLD